MHYSDKLHSDKLQEQFSDYIEGEMLPQARQAFELQLRNDSEAAQKLERVRALREHLTQLPTITTSPDFEQRLHNRIGEQKFRRLDPFPFSSHFNWKTSIAAAAAVLLIAVSSMLFVDSEPATINLQQSNQTGLGPSMPPANSSMMTSKPSQPSMQALQEDAQKARKDSTDLEKKMNLRNGIQYVNEKSDGK